MPVFTALHTVVNEYSEIRSMTLTPTKVHSQFMPALQALSNSLITYGHSPIELVFTNNPRLNKSELEANIPSLLKDVVPVPNVSSLWAMTLPNNSQILLLTSPYQVNTRLNSIMNSVPDSHDFYVAVDMEWAVNCEVGIQGHVAIISMTYGEEIFLIPVCQWFPDNFVPQN